MSSLTLYPGDPRLGKHHPDGTREWPQVDLVGNPYEKRYASRQHLTAGDGTRYFVVLPPNWKGEQVAVLGTPPAPEAAPLPVEVVTLPPEAAEGEEPKRKRATT